MKSCSNLISLATAIPGAFLKGSQGRVWHISTISTCYYCGSGGTTNADTFTVTRITPVAVDGPGSAGVPRLFFLAFARCYQVADKNNPSAAASIRCVHYRMNGVKNM